MASVFRAKLYANKAGKAEGRQNKFQVSGDREQFQAIADGDKDLLKDLLGEVKRELKA